VTAAWLTAAGVLAGLGNFVDAGTVAFVSNAHGWSCLAGSPSRIACVRAPAPTLNEVAWTRSTDADGNTIDFIDQAGVVASADLVFAVGHVSPPGKPQGQPRLFAFSRENGEVVWWSPISAPVGVVNDSYSTPAIDVANGVIIHGSGYGVTAFDLANGDVRWQATLTGVGGVVNASPLVTQDRGPGDRVFMTDYDGPGTQGRLYCINADTFDTALNPYEPGEVLWSVVIGGTSGNSVAYLPTDMGGTGLVYVATVGEYDVAGGQIMAFPAGALTTPTPVWTFTNPQVQGFFGGLCIARGDGPCEGPWLYSATYAFYGGLSAARLVKVDGSDGSLVWSTPCNRTQSIPVPMPGGRIALAGGVWGGFGTAPSVELFQDSGATVSRLWNTWSATGQTLSVGGWTQQPMACLFGGESSLIVGALPMGFSAPINDLYVLDLNSTPGAAGFVRQHVQGAGGTAALAGLSLYSVGAMGLVAFGPKPSGLDINSDGVRGIDDLYAWEQGCGERDVNGDGTIDGADRTALVLALRSAEPAQLTGPRP